MGENNNSDNDVTEVSQRLKAVSNGAATQEFTLRRNQLGQLGFHVQVFPCFDFLKRLRHY